jgi:hypothetical protein
MLRNTVLSIMGMALLDVLVAGSAAAQPETAPFDECGRLVLRDFCTMFAPYRPSSPFPLGYFQLENMESFVAGDTVRVVGTQVWCAGVCFPTGCVKDNTISTCSLTAIERRTWGSLKSIYR